MINSLIHECDGLIYSIASNYKNNYNIEDLYQAGYVGVMKAYNNFNNNLNVKFSTYAYGYILGEIIDFIRKDRTIRVSNDYYDIYSRYVKTKDLLTNKLCREPLLSEISEFMEIEESKLVAIIERTLFTKSIDEVEIDYQIDDNLINKLSLETEIDKLNEPGKSIIRYRYYYGLSQSETAEALSLSQSKVSREETLSLKRMKQNIVA